MINILRLIFSLIIILPLVACGNNESSPADNSKQPSATDKSAVATESSPPKNQTESILIAYYSYTGNTEKIANQIHEILGGDIVQIETADPYPEDYNTMVNQAVEEIENGYKPPLSTNIGNIDKYSVVYIGYPIWDYILPPPVVTFLSEYDFSGKTIIPFCSHGGTGAAQSVPKIKELCPNVTVLSVFAIEGSRANDAQESILTWLEEIGIVTADSQRDVNK